MPAADQADAAPSRSTAQTRSRSKDTQNIGLRRGDAPSVKEIGDFHVEPPAAAHDQHRGIEPGIEKYMFSTNIVRTRKLTPLGMATCTMLS
jgi:hypothetical protein